MNFLELIQGKIIFQSIPSELIKTTLQFRSLGWADCYDVSSLQNFELTIADLYVELMAMPEFKEGTLSIKYDANQLSSMAKTIYAKYDDDKLSLFPTTTTKAIESVNLW